MDQSTRTSWVEPPSPEYQAENPGWNKPVLSPAAPIKTARKYVELFHTKGAIQTLHHQAKTFFSWAKTHYQETSDEEVNSKIWKFLEEAETQTKQEGITEPFNPNNSKVANVEAALRAVTQLNTNMHPPVWLDGRREPNPAEIVSCTNGLLHLPTQKLLPHSPEFFSLNALDFDYQPQAAEPEHWLKFLNEIWPGDRESIETLQEMFGLLLTGDTSHQKAFLIVGPKRSGKGTIARILTALLGRENVAGPTLSSLGQNFGLAPLIGKRLAIISDARLGGKADQQMVVERILSITGEDTLSVDRKFKEAWTGRLQARFLVLTNELPRLSDASGALASRFLILLMTNSFYGKEDRALTDKLLAELPGILNWSLEGWKKLKDRKHFVQPKSATEAQKDFEDLGSPIGAFVRDCCDLGPTLECLQGDLYSRWLSWCHDQNILRPGTIQMFARDIRSVVPSIKKVQHRNKLGKPERWFAGLQVKNEAH